MPAAARHARRSQPRHTSGLDGRGGSSYIDKVVFRDRDTNADGGRDERRYYLQNWRNDVVALITTTGAWVERYRYDAYGRPESYSVADIAGSGGGGGGPNGLVTSTDSAAYSATGAVSWKNDLGSSGGSLVPDNVVNATDDLAAFNVYYAAGNNGGLGQISDTAIDNRKGLAGYEFDPILAGDGAIDGTGVPLYHVRNRVLNSYSGKWMQKDPMGYHDSMDLYEYCGSDALDLGDALGLAMSTLGSAGCSPCSGRNVALLSQPINTPDAVGPGLSPSRLGPPFDFGPRNTLPGEMVKCLDSPEMKFLLKQVGSKCRANGWTFNVSACGANDPDCIPTLGAGTGTRCGITKSNPSAKTVDVCLCPDFMGNYPARCGGVCSTLMEELIHAWQYCAQNQTPITPETTMCFEVAADYRVGKCSSAETCCASLCKNPGYLTRFGYPNSKLGVEQCYLDCYFRFDTCILHYLPAPYPNP
ncbi:MAG: hypothetical protein Q8L55_13280 [Phycisphaerales bacterium]|nr:hypothetical protein [Phycisphaerales bacterium]